MTHLTAKREAHGAGAHTEFAGLWPKFMAVRRNIDAVVYEQLVLSLLFLRALSECDPAAPESCAAAAVLRDPARWPLLVSSAQTARETSLLRQLYAQIAADLPFNLIADLREAELDERVLRDAILLVDAIDLKSGERRSERLADIFSFCTQQFALLKSEPGGALFTPASIAKLLVALAAPRDGAIFDPCAGSGGLLVHAWNAVRAANAQFCKTKLFGRELNPSAWRATRMNLIMRGVPHDLGHGPADFFRGDLHADLSASCILADPPFNMEDWMPATSAEQEWEFGAPPRGNANFAWVQQIIRHLAPNGVACLTLANASLSSLTRGEPGIRRKLVEAGLLDCVVALPAELFPASRISACVWVLSKRARAGEVSETLFIDAQHMGRKIERAQREFRANEIDKVAETYHAWRNNDNYSYRDIPGFCRSVGTGELLQNRCILIPSRYVGVEPPAAGAVSLSNIEGLMRKFHEQLAESNKLDQAIKERLGQFVRV